MNHLRTDIHSLRLKQEQYGLTSERRLTEQEHAVRNIQNSIGNLQNIQRQANVAQRQILLEQDSLIHEQIAQVLATQQRLEVKLDAIKVAALEKAVQEIASSVSQPNSNIQCLKLHSIFVSASIMQSKGSNHCACACHRRSIIKTPQLLHRVLGTLFIGYVGIPRLTPSCDTRTCIRRSSFTAMVTYTFPMWFLARAVFMVIKMSSYLGPQFSLTVSRIVAHSSAIFEYAVRGDIDDLKEILSHRIASPCDISYPEGYSVLMVRPILFTDYLD